MALRRAMITAARGGGFLLLLAAATTQARGAPANTLSELWRVLGACSRVSDVPAAVMGSEITVLFSLRRDGSLQGKPQITHAHLLGDTVAQQTFVAGALAAVARCLPVAVTDGLGGAIAGRPLRLRLTSRQPETAT